MRIHFKAIIGVLALALVVSVVASTTQAQGMKIGFIDEQRIKQEFKDWQKAQDEFETEVKAWEQEAIAKQEALQEMEEEYQRQRLILSEEKKTERETLIREKYSELDAYTKQIFGPGGQAERKEAQLLRPLYEKLMAAIEGVALENDYDVVFTSQSGLGYIKPIYDVTDKVIDYLDRMDG
jgi:outer membrane protein